jgi:hypothetical protein
MTLIPVEKHESVALMVHAQIAQATYIYIGNVYMER